MLVSSCSVAVVSYADVGNFGDRLGYHMINAVLSAEVDVHHLSFNALQAERRATI